MTESPITESRVTAHFHQTAGNFGQVDTTRRFAYFGERLVAAAGLAPGQQILDVATGRGAVLWPAAAAVGPTGRVIGTDMAPGMIEATAAEVSARGLAQVTVQVMDAESLAFPAASFEALLCGFGLMFFPHLSQALAGFRRVLTPGGRLAVSTWAAVDPRFHWELDLWRKFGIFDRHISQLMTQPLLEPRELGDALTAAGFVEVELHQEVDQIVHRDAAHWWERLQAGGATRAVLDSLEPEERDRFQQEAAVYLAPLGKADGIHQSVPANFAVARNP
jgi:ubiquinone/menaquinone biosynthesis C-methylase UbiE